MPAECGRIASAGKFRGKVFKTIHMIVLNFGMKNQARGSKLGLVR